MTYTPEQIAAHIADRAQHVGEDSPDVRILRQLVAEMDMQTAAKVRGVAINEFALAAGIPLSDVAKNLPQDVKEYRMNSAVAAMQARRKSGAKS